MFVFSMTPAWSQTCPGDPGYVLDVSPDVVPIGTVFMVTIQAPAGTSGLLLMSDNAGPTNTQFGTLCVGFPFAGIFPFSVGDSGSFTVDHLLECEPSVVGITAFFQFIAVSPGDSEVHMSNSDMITIVDGSCSGGFEPGDFVTYTQGAWGQECNGNNFGCTRDEQFDAVFPNGLVLGDPDGVDGDQEFALVLTSSQAVEDLLPTTGRPGPLTEDLTDPVSTPAGVLAGQLVAAKGNVAFDDAGIFDDQKKQDALKLGDLVFVACVDPDLLGMSVRDLIALAESMLSGAVASPADVTGDGVGDVTYSDVSDALAVVNENFADGTSNFGCLGTSFP